MRSANVGGGEDVAYEQKERPLGPQLGDRRDEITDGGHRNLFVGPGGAHDDCNGGSRAELRSFGEQLFGDALRVGSGEQYSDRPTELCIASE